MTTKDECLAIPTTLSIEGKTAALTILEHAKREGNANPGGCVTFYDPVTWAEKGEQYGLGSILIVCHDGGDFAPMFNLDYCDYKSYDKMYKSLRNAGFYAEQCTSWYSAIYPDKE